jgi:uncharacterized repeat protein (TIGR03803 family)
MRSRVFAVSAVVAVAVLAEAAAGQARTVRESLLIPAPDVVTYKTLYSFKGNPTDGAGPYAGLIDVSGSLFGTTAFGGGTGCLNSAQQIVGCGTVFEVNTAGTERVRHSFAGYPTDGSAPYGSLIDLKGELYGTTSYGGNVTVTNGTIFDMSPAGTEHVLYNFEGIRGAGYAPDAETPDAGVIAFQGKLYGTTSLGGAYGGGYGSVFESDTTGAEQLVYSFQGFPDGEYPYAGLTNVNGTLYGTTPQGGTSFSGVVFTVSTTGTEHVVYTFTGYPYGPDGVSPYGGLIAVGGTLYGTTAGGGANAHGTVFAVTPSGAEHVIYSFKGTPDGATPYAGLVAVGNRLYGTTTAGGASGNGTVFQVTTSGIERVLHSFRGTPDGAAPYAPLLLKNGSLVGTTTAGGKTGNGTIFELTP